jgi:hypothetical protein
MDTNKTVSFVMAMRDFFGLRPGTKLTDFADELRALSENDKAELRAGLIANGYKIS